MCLAAGCNKKEEALAWMHEAISVTCYWHHNDVLEDDDLEPLFQEQQYIYCKMKSAKRFAHAQAESVTELSFESKQKENLLVWKC